MRQAIDAEPEQQEPETEPMETIHVYMVRENPEQPKKPSQRLKRTINLCMQVLALAMLAGFCVQPHNPVYAVKTIVVPATFSPIVFRAQEEIKPTGVKTIPATRARGALTIYNGSILSESLPAGFIVTAQSGVEIATDQAVTIPPAALPEPGVATVPAHAVVLGAAGNIAADTLDQAVGSSLVVKNLAAFRGGNNASTKHFVTDADRARAIAAARGQVESQVSAEQHPGVLAGCSEAVQQHTESATVTWSCQYATWKTPAGAQVLSAQVQGKSVVLQVREVVLPQ